MRTGPGTLLRDGVFWWALIAGPVVWAGMLATFGVEAPGQWKQHLGLLFWLAIVLPILEELTFRSLIQETLRLVTCRSWGPLSSANVITSFIFSASHTFFHPLTWALATFFPSLIFGVFKERYCSIVAPIGLHVFYNTGYLLLFFHP